MKTIDLIGLICLGMVFVCAGLSAMMFYGQGIDKWLWQVLTMYYSGRHFIHKYKNYKK
mgnify:CR=1 FL=1